MPLLLDIIYILSNTCKINFLLRFPLLPDFIYPKLSAKTGQDKFKWLKIYIYKEKNQFFLLFPFSLKLFNSKYDDFF